MEDYKLLNCMNGSFRELIRGADNLITKAGYIPVFSPEYFCFPRAKYKNVTCNIGEKATVPEVFDITEIYHEHEVTTVIPKETMHTALNSLAEFQFRIVPFIEVLCNEFNNRLNLDGTSILVGANPPTFELPFTRKHYFQQTPEGHYLLGIYYRGTTEEQYNQYLQKLLTAE